MIIWTYPVSSVSGVYMGGNGPPGLNTMECHLDDTHTTVSPFLTVRLPGKNSGQLGVGRAHPRRDDVDVRAARPQLLVEHPVRRLDDVQAVRNLLEWLDLLEGDAVYLVLLGHVLRGSPPSTTITPLWKSCIPQT